MECVKEIVEEDKEFISEDEDIEIIDIEEEEIVYIYFLCYRKLIVKG